MFTMVYLLFRAHTKAGEAFLAREVEKQQMVNAGERLLNIMRAVDRDHDTLISYNEFQQAFQKVNAW